MNQLDELRYARLEKLNPKELHQSFYVLTSCFEFYHKKYGDGLYHNTNQTGTEYASQKQIFEHNNLSHSSLDNDSIDVIKQMLSFSCDICNPSYDENVTILWDYGICQEPNRVVFNMAVYAFYISILVAAVVGNVLVVYVVGGTAKMRTVTNYFIVNLAVGDLCTAIVCIPFTFVTTLILQYWPFGREMCIAVNYVQVSYNITLK